MNAYPRIIPALLLSGGRLVKTQQFRDPVYVGDPVNVLSIFNDFEVDEIALLDIDAARSRRVCDLGLLRQLATECFIPLSYGGGISDVHQAREIVAAGFEKVIVNTAMVEAPQNVAAITRALGSQAVVAAVDVRGGDGEYRVVVRGAERDAGMDLDQWMEQAERLGIGEVMVTSVDREGTRVGLDLDLVKVVTAAMTVPVIAHGGAGTRQDLLSAVRDADASAVAAGTQFVFQNGRGSVLVNYPTRPQIEALFADHVLGSGRGSYEPVDQLPAAVPTELAVAVSAGTETDTCSRCIIRADVPNASFDDEGLCYYCRLHDSMEAQYPVGERGAAELERFASRLKEAGRGKPYDCVLGVSGGCDSSYLAHLLVELGVRPLAVHFDNTWNSPIATSNIYAVLEKLGIDLETYVVDNTEYDDIYRSFLKAGVRDIEAPTDIGFMGVLYRAAEKHGIKHIVEGHSFRTEGVSPLGWLYMDGGYVASVHERHGTVPLKTYPNMTFRQFMKWTAFSRIERARPLYYMDYDKEATKAFLQQEYGWQWYGGHHLENRFTAFYHSYFLPRRFGIDFRMIELSALVRSGQLARSEAFARMAQEREGTQELVALVKKRLGFDDAEFDRLMASPHRTYRDYDTYKRRFELLRPFFWLMYRLDRVPKSFYVKFCLPAPLPPAAS